MKQIFAAVLLLASLSAVAAPESFTLEPSHVYPHWSVRHLGFSQLQGQFNTTSGKFTIDRQAHSGQVQVTIDAASLDSGHAKRDGHLKSEEFFNADKFPAITYRASKTRWDGDRLVAVDGELTLLGVTKPVTLTVSNMACGENPMAKIQYRCGFDASTTLKRSDYGMTYGLPNIGDEVLLTFEVEGTRD